jgi:hypothetical protein
MRKKLQLSIPQPCHEDWDQMNPDDKGRFCASCHKTVIDFSAMNDRELAEFFKRPTLRQAQGSVCGRFTNEQLDRDIELPRKRIPWLKYFFQFALPAFFISLKASAEKTPGKIKLNEVSKDTLTPPHQELYMLGTITAGKCLKTVVPQKKEIKKQEVRNDTIYIKPISITTEKANSISCYRVKNNEAIKINPPSFNQLEVVSILQCTVGGVSVSVINNKIKSPLKNQKETLALKKTPEENPTQLNSAFKIYPNPASPGESIDLAVENLEEGYYMMQFFSLNGQLMNEKEIWIDQEARLLNTIVPPLAKGEYLVVLRNNKTEKRYTEKLVIE